MGLFIIKIDQPGVAPGLLHKTLQNGRFARPASHKTLLAVLRLITNRGYNRTFYRSIKSNIDKFI